MKLNRLFLLAAFTLLLMGVSNAQTTPAPTTPPSAPAANATDLTNDKIRKLDLLIKLVPLALQKDQYPDLLAGIDAARVLRKAEQDREDKILADLDADVTAAVTNAVEKGIYPPRDLQTSIAQKIAQMSNKQILVGANMVKTIYSAIQAKLNEGQRKAMAGSFSDAYIDSKMKPEDMTDVIKINFFIRNVFMDNDCYDLLVDMSKHAS